MSAQGLGRNWAGTVHAASTLSHLEGKGWAGWHGFMCYCSEIIRDNLKDIFPRLREEENEGD